MIMTERRLGILAGCIFIVVGALAFMVARTIPRRMPVGIDSGVLPEIICAGLFICGVLLAAFCFFGPNSDPDEDVPNAPISNRPAPNPRALALFFNITLIVGYVVSLPYLGFILSSAIFFFFQLGLLDGWSMKGMIRRAAFAVIATGLIWLLFEKGFGMILPAGLLG